MTYKEKSTLPAVIQCSEISGIEQHFPELYQNISSFSACHPFFLQSGKVAVCLQRHQKCPRIVKRFALKSNATKWTKQNRNGLHAEGVAKTVNEVSVFGNRVNIDPAVDINAWNQLYGLTKFKCKSNIQAAQTLEHDNSAQVKK